MGTYFTARHRNVRSGLAALLLGACGALTVAVGCAGSASHPAAVTGGRSALHFTVQWPQRAGTRVIPNAAKSLKFTVMASEPDFDQKVGESLVARPAGNTTSEVTLNNLPTKVQLRVAVTAYPNEDGTGVAEAVSTQDFRAGDSGSTVEAAITLGSTIARVEANPASVSTLVTGGASVTVTAFDSDGNVVPTSPDSWTWASDRPAVATVTATGTTVSVSGVSGGSATVTGTNADSGKSVTVPVSVTAFNGPPGCKFPGQLYGDFCGKNSSGTSLYWNCETGGCEEPLVK